MKTLTLLLATATLASAAPLTDLDTELKKTWPNNRTVNIVFHGHSVPSGYFVAPDVRPFESYPHFFHRDLKQRYPNAVVNVITTSIGGENSIPGAARFQADVLKHKPDLIFIDYALNDRSQDAAAVETAWRSMITAAKTAGVPVVLCTPTGDTREDLSDPANRLRVLADMIRRLASEEDVLLADVSAAWVAELQSGTPQADLHSTANHPNAAGHRVAADAILQSFVSATEDSP
ncbi:acyl-CoA thioesterase [Haloferula helveola]|uniref:Acyl-CoA thioesterase n=1 Tax=Haloferula helveola TaxID=490095 RepID=A0ABM7RJJ1_9BACT|nr:acyl-CoA thioesterase [Haloferula helveola]